MPPDPLAGELPARGQPADGLDVDLQELGELLRGHDLVRVLAPEGRATDQGVLPQRTQALEVAVPRDEPGYQLPLRRLQLECRAVELLGLRCGQADEEGRGVL